MKTSKMNIDFAADTATIFGLKQKLLFTSSRNYCIPLGNYLELSKTSKNKVSDNKIVIYNENWSDKSYLEKKNIIWKLHRQFSHASYRKIESLLKDAAIKDKEAYAILTEVSNSCEICRKYKKAPYKPAVGLAIGHILAEIIAIDLKEWMDSPYKT